MHASCAAVMSALVSLYPQPTVMVRKATQSVTIHSGYDFWACAAMAANARARKTVLFIVWSFGGGSWGRRGGKKNTTLYMNGG